MKTKLTLSLEESIIKSAKKLAEERNTSVSELLSDYVLSQIELSKKLNSVREFGVESPPISLVAEDDEKLDYLTKKYGLEE